MTDASTGTEDLNPQPVPDEHGFTPVSLLHRSSSKESLASTHSDHQPTMENPDNKCKRKITTSSSSYSDK